MNKDQTKECIRIMQAFVDGKEIQTRNRGNSIYGEWHEALPEWDWLCCEYRIKPEPKIIYVNEKSVCDMHAYHDEGTAKSLAGLTCTNVAVPYVRLSDVELLK